jgi:hypothetical protein
MALNSDLRTSPRSTLGKLDLEFDANYIYNYTFKQLVGANPNSTPHFTLWNELDSYFVPDPDFKALASLFYSKTLFGVDTFRTGVTLHYLDSEHDINDNFKGTRANFSSDVPGTNYVHLIGSWTTLDGRSPISSVHQRQLLPRRPSPGMTRKAKESLEKKR